MWKKINIKIQTTPSHSPWSNGLCESHNQTLTSTSLKIKDDVNCEFDSDLAWAVCAKNSLFNSNGFSPSQLVFGRNTNLSNFINNQESTIKLFDLGLHISVLHSVKKAFIQSESNKKLKPDLAWAVCAKSTREMIEMNPRKGLCSN